ncbi:MAG: hypothetical protein GXY53_00855, partial [Desulfobulbus sp.]|nr:hypothetical protein [Desulfobulbus sp.]
CQNTDTEPSEPQDPAPVQQAAAPVKTGCQECHDTIRLDADHQLACTGCHQGVDQQSDADRSHAGLVARPAHPDHMQETCGDCHAEQVATAAGSLHFTLAKKVNTVRQHFGTRNTLISPLDIPQSKTIDTPLALADDLLRRRCLRCHVYSPGDDYSAVTHGTGCSACHLPFKNGSLTSHAFALPTDRQCLSCHYGNTVGSDYYGRYEHDYNWEYRTPYSTTTPGNIPRRPYGVEWHELSTDIHLQRGLSCTDCHQKIGHGTPVPVTCQTCHGWQPGQAVPALTNVSVRDRSLIVRSRIANKEHQVPSLRHPAHEQYGQKVACQVCHGQWSYNDGSTHLLLSKHEDYDPWERLTVQASSEVETLLDHNLHYSDELPLTMRDGLTGTAKPGIWYQGFIQRRWEQMEIHRDSDGIIKVFRPILDLHLSMVEADGTVPFDNITGQTDTLRPYTPHTTGPAGLFYRDRFQHLLSDNAPQP